jgi:L-asparagine transporter-like permease
MVLSNILSDIQLFLIVIGVILFLLVYSFIFEKCKFKELIETVKSRNFFIKLIIYFIIMFCCHLYFKKLKKEKNETKAKKFKLAMSQGTIALLIAFMAKFHFIFMPFYAVALIVFFVPGISDVEE